MGERDENLINDNRLDNKHTHCQRYDTELKASIILQEQRWKIFNRKIVIKYTLVEMVQVLLDCWCKL
jgi:hypothetical protein